MRESGRSLLQGTVRTLVDKESRAGRYLLQVSDVLVYNYQHVPVLQAACNFG
jgi:hypothetical protein